MDVSSWATHPGTFNMDGISGYISDSSETRSGGNSPALNTLSEEFLRKLRDKRINMASQSQHGQAADEPREMSGQITENLDPSPANIKMELLIDNGEEAAHSTTDQLNPVTMLPDDIVTSDPVKSRKSRSRSLSRSVSRSKSRSPKPSSKRHRSKLESPKRQKHSRSRTPKRKRRSRSRSRSLTPRRSHRSRSRTPKRKPSRSKTPKRKRRSRSRTPKRSRSRSPKRRRRSRSRSRSRSPLCRRRSRSRTPARRRRQSVNRSSDRRRKRSRSRSRDKKRRHSRSYSKERRRSSDRSRRRKHNRSRSRSGSKIRSKSKSLSRSPSPRRAGSSDDPLDSLASKLDVLSVQVARLETVQSSMVHALNNLIQLVQSLRHQQPTTSDAAWPHNQSPATGGKWTGKTTTLKQMFPSLGPAIPSPKILSARKKSSEAQPVLAGQIGEDGIVQLGLPMAEPPVLIHHTFLQKALGISPDAKTYSCKLLKHLYTEEEMSKCNFEGSRKMQGGVTEKLDPLRMNAILSQVELDFPGCMTPKELSVIRKAINAACRSVRFKTRMQNPPAK